MYRKAVIFAVFSLILTIFGPVTQYGDSITLTNFTDLSTEKTYTFGGSGGTDTSSSIELPQRAMVTDARVNVSTVTNPSSNYPRNPSVDLDNDGETEWQFVGTGYGPFGQQRDFGDGDMDKSYIFFGAGYKNNDTIMLPKNATVTSTSLTLTGASGVLANVTAPNTYHTTDGNTYNSLPFRWSSTIRYQQMYYSSQLSVMAGSIIDKIWFRTDVHSTWGSGTGSVTFQNTKVYLSHKSGSTMSSTYSANYGTERTLVYDGSYTYVWSGSFQYTVLDVEDIFVYNGVDNLVFEISWTGASGSYPTYGYLDHASISTQGDRIYSTSATASTGSRTANYGPVTRFQTLGGPPVDAKLDIGDDDVDEWFHPGQFTGSEFCPDLTGAFNSILATWPPTHYDAYGNAMVEIPYNVTSDDVSILDMDNLRINYTCTTEMFFNPFQGNLTNTLNSILHHGRDGNRVFSMAVHSDSAGSVKLQNISIDYFIPRVSIDECFLYDGQGPLNDKCYAGYRPYTVQVEVSSRMGYNDISDVILTLDTSGAQVQLKWNRTLDTFIELSDPSNYYALNPSSYAWNDGDDGWTLNFTGTFSWNYPNENLVTCNVDLWYANGLGMDRDWEEVYWVENDLDFVGSVSAVAAVQGTLSSGDWVLGNETINWTGLTVVYQGSTDVYPDDSTFDVTITNDSAYPWINVTSSGSAFTLTTQVDPKTDHTDIHHIDITGIPGSGVDVSSVTFEVKVDATAPAPPNSFIVHADGPGVGSTQWDNDGNVYTSWIGGPWQDTQSGKFDDALGYEDVAPTDLLPSGHSWSLGEGHHTFYVRTRDNVGNWGVSIPASIDVDLTDIVFSGQYPTDDVWLTHRDVDLGLNIADTGGSGVDADTIQFRYSEDGVLDNELWQDHFGEVSKESIDVEESIEFLSDGTKSFQWRAKDVADGLSTSDPGPPHSSSIHYYLKIDSIPPTFRGNFPTGWVKSTSVSTGLFINDTEGSNVDMSTIEYRKSTTGPTGFGSWTQLGLTGEQEVAAIEEMLTFEDGSDNYIQWRASDVATNSETSSTYQVFVDTNEPVYYDSNPDPEIWQTSNWLQAGITIADNLSGLVGTTVKYSISTTGPDGFGGWKDLALPGVYSVLNLNVNDTYAEGDDNFIRWSVEDVAGNHLVTDPMKISVDTLGVEFSGPTPAEGLWQIDHQVTCGINISDIGESRVDVSSIMYRFSTDGEDGFGDWKDLASAPPAGEIVHAEATVALDDGKDNYIQWKATDMARSKTVVSERYPIWVDSLPVSFTDALPEMEFVSNSVDVFVMITVLDEGGSGVDPESVHYAIAKGDPNAHGEWKAVTTTPGADADRLEVSDLVKFPCGRDNYIVWRAHDMAGTEEVVSGPVLIQVNCPPTAKIVLPSDEVEMGSAFTLDGRSSSDPDTDDSLKYEWSSNLIQTSLGDEGQLTHTFNIPGTHTITLTVTDSHGLTDTTTSTLVVNVPPAPPDEEVPDDPTDDDDNGTVPVDKETEDDKESGLLSGMTLWIIILIIIMVVVVIVGLVMMKRGEKDLPPMPPVSPHPETLEMTEPLDDVFVEALVPEIVPVEDTGFVHDGDVQVYELKHDTFSFPEQAATSTLPPPTEYSVAEMVMPIEPQPTMIPVEERPTMRPVEPSSTIREVESVRPVEGPAMKTVDQVRPVEGPAMRPIGTVPGQRTGTLVVEDEEPVKDIFGAFED